ncbi:Rrf2 family transcriptional regulator [Candidatus Peregrinibacteria bacterium]|nr:Rrf2 family transcriptional regulator [Candidatus Peregrinibacteria bacterium]
MNKNSKVCKNRRGGALHLTQKVDYGILLLTSLAGDTRKHKSIKKIAEEKNLSFSFLQKIARMLHEANIIKSERGKYGGYKLAKAPEEIPLKQIIEVLEGRIAIVPCLKSTKTCWDCAEGCEVRSSLQNLNNEIMKCFSSKNLDYFLNNK